MSSLLFSREYRMFWFMLALVMVIVTTVVVGEHYGLPDTLLFSIWGVGTLLGVVRICMEVQK